MSNIAFEAARKLINGLGYEVVKRKAAASAFRMDSWLNNLNINSVIDIGANEGQFIQALNDTLPGKKIVAFEPIKECYEKLLVNTRGMNIVAHNIGLSDVEGTTEINISKNFVSSSILPIENITTELYPDSSYTSKQEIVLKRLDDVLANEEMPANILMKIDVQGYEDKVLSGALETIKKVSAVVIEFSYQALYEGQWLFDETYAFFSARGFRFVGIIDQVLSAKTGIPLYGDAVFVKADILDKVYHSS